MECTNSCEKWGTNSYTFERASAFGPELFEHIDSGLHDGYLIDCLGNSIASIREKFGIEEHVALASQGTAQGFFNWAEMKTGVALTDWEPVELTLFMTWQTFSAKESAWGLPCSFSTWGTSDGSSYGWVVAAWPVKVFAIRHRAWPLLTQKRIREFYVALQRSAMNARWARNGMGREMEPGDMDGDEAGFSISGKLRGMTERKKLTWPFADLLEVINEAEKLKKKRVADLLISQHGGGYPFNSRTREAWLRAAALDKKFGGNGLLVDLGRYAGLSY